MKEMLNRFHAVCTLTILMCQIGSACGQPIIYNITYDPLLLKTTVVNDPTSLAAVELRSVTGGAAEADFWFIDPGETMTLTTLPGGAVQVVGGKRKPVPPNPPDPWISNTFNYPGNPFHVVFPPGPPGPNTPMIKPRSAPDTAYVAMVASMNFGGGCYRVKWKRKGPGWKIEDPVEAVVDPLDPSDLFDNFVDIHTDDTDPTYPWSIFPANQTLYGLGAGQLRFETSAGNFISAYTPNTAVGCPEPSGAIAVSVTMLALGHRRRRLPAECEDQSFADELL